MWLEDKWPGFQAKIEGPPNSATTQIHQIELEMPSDACVFCFVLLGALNNPRDQQGGPICLLGSRRLAYPPIKPTSPYLAHRVTNLR